MRRLRLVRFAELAVIVVPLAGLFGACSSGASGGTSVGSGGAGGGSSESGTLSTGAGGGAPDASAPDAATECPGDAGAWAQLTAGPIACENGPDCCVIINPCLSTAQVVAASQMEECLAAWPACEGDCTDCVPPAIDVACVAGRCLGRVVIGEAPASDLRANHCGADLKILDFPGKTGVHFPCGG